jgi:hypothetical protein
MKNTANPQTAISRLSQNKKLSVIVLGAVMTIAQYLVGLAGLVGTDNTITVLGLIVTGALLALFTVIVKIKRVKIGLLLLAFVVTVFIIFSGFRIIALRLIVTGALLALFTVMVKKERVKIDLLLLVSVVTVAILFLSAWLYFIPYYVLVLVTGFGGAWLYINAKPKYCCICGKELGIFNYVPLTAKSSDGKRLCECRPCYNKVAETEVRRKCNVCGHIFCYTLADLERNKKLAKGALLTGVSGLAGALSGRYTAAAVQQGNAANSMNRIIDYNKCPKCNSTALRALSEEEFQKEQQIANTPQTSAPAVSNADELKKFKELLDGGVITQEEFDEKKKQLLGL